MLGFLNQKAAAQERGGLLQELGFGESQFLKFGDFGAFKERLRSVAIEENTCPKK